MSQPSQIPQTLALESEAILDKKIVTQSKTLPPGPFALESEAILE